MAHPRRGGAWGGRRSPREGGRADQTGGLSGGRSCSSSSSRTGGRRLGGRASPGTSRGRAGAAPRPGRLRPRGEAPCARRDQQHEQRLQQPRGGRGGLLLHRQDLLLQESASGQVPFGSAGEWRAPGPGVGVVVGWSRLHVSHPFRRPDARLPAGGRAGCRGWPLPFRIPKGAGKPVQWAWGARGEGRRWKGREPDGLGRSARRGRGLRAAGAAPGAWRCPGRSGWLRRRPFRGQSRVPAPSWLLHSGRWAMSGLRARGGPPRGDRASPPRPRARCGAKGPGERWRSLMSGLPESSPGPVCGCCWRPR